MAESNRPYDPEQLKANIYRPELPEDIGPIRQLLAEYSGLPAEEASAHMLAVVSRTHYAHSESTEIVCLLLYSPKTEKEKEN